MTQEDILQDENQAEQEKSADMLQIKRSHAYALLLPLAFVAGLAVGFLFWGQQKSPSTAAASPTAPGGTQQPSRIDIPREDDPSLGPEDAPIVIVEFSDFNCTFCRKWHEETFEPMMEAYPDQIHFIYRDFPITSNESFLAAQAAECADDQGAFWPFHDALFSGKYPLSRSAYESYAEELGLDVDALLECLDSNKYAQEVEGDARFASSIGASGTPTFFINGLPLVGAQPLAIFTQLIDQELGNE